MFIRLLLLHDIKIIYYYLTKYNSYDIAYLKNIPYLRNFVIGAGMFYVS